MLDGPKVLSILCSPLLAVPDSRNLGISHLPLQLENTVHQRLARGRASGHVDVDGDDSVTSANHTVAIVIVASSIGAAAHADYPSGLRHLIVDLTQRRSHLVGESTGDNHDVRLTGRGSENNSKTILIVSRGGQVHHFDGAAGESEGHGP